MKDLADIEKVLTVPLPPRAAFALFTDDIGRWWPVESHSISASAGRKPRAVEMGQGPGEHITEITHDGREVRWGTLTEWEPGRALAFDWYVGGTPEDATTVRVVFLPVEAGTRIELTHGGWSALSAGAAERREGYVPGWSLVLGRFVSFAGSDGVGSTEIVRDSVPS